MQASAHKRKTRSVALALVVGALFPACGSGEDKAGAGGAATATTGTVPATTAVSVTVPTMATTTLPPVPVRGKSVSLSGGFTNADGYSFRVKVNYALGGPVLGKSDDFGPGESGFVVPVKAVVTIELTATGTGTAYNPLSGANLMGLWKVPSRLCPFASTGSPDPNFLGLNGKYYCVGQLAQVGNPPSLHFPPGKAIALPVAAEGCQSHQGRYNNSGCQDVEAAGNEDAWQYASKQLPAAMAAISRPPDLVVLLGSLESRSQPKAACMPSDNLGWVALASAPITSCRA